MADRPERLIATLCPDCQGTGDIITKHPGSTVPSRRWDCDTCRTIGYVLTEEEPTPDGHVRIDGVVYELQDLHSGSTNRYRLEPAL